MGGCAKRVGSRCHPASVAGGRHRGLDPPLDQNTTVRHVYWRCTTLECVPIIFKVLTGTRYAACISRWACLAVYGSFCANVADVRFVEGPRAGSPRGLRLTVSLDGQVNAYTGIAGLELITMYPK